MSLSAVVSVAPLCWPVGNPSQGGFLELGVIPPHAIIQVMSQMNAQMDPKKTAQVMQQFGRQVEVSNVKEDLLNDALMDAVSVLMGVDVSLGASSCLPPPPRSSSIDASALNALNAPPVRRRRRGGGGRRRGQPGPARAGARHGTTGSWVARRMRRSINIRTTIHRRRVTDRLTDRSTIDRSDGGRAAGQAPHQGRGGRRHGLGGGRGGAPGPGAAAAALGDVE